MICCVGDPKAGFDKPICLETSAFGGSALAAGSSAFSAILDAGSSAGRISRTADSASSCSTDSKVCCQNSAGYMASETRTTNYYNWCGTAAAI